MRRQVEVADFLLELYQNASDCRPDEFRLKSLRNLQDLVPFDFALWGGGRAEDRQVTDLVTLDQSRSILWQWQDVAAQDAFCDLTMSHLGTTARFDDVPDYRDSLAFNEHWRRFDATEMMATIQAEPVDGYVSFVGLCAKERAQEFSDTERDFKNRLMPHLSQALRMNRELWTARAAEEHDAVVLVNEGGWVLATQGLFEDIAQREWGRRLTRIPPAVMQELCREGIWHGREVTTRLSRLEGNLLVRFRSRAALSCLSLRERQVAEMFASGLTHKQVARTLESAPSTVRNQLARIYEKLGISSKAALVALIARP